MADRCYVVCDRCGFFYGDVILTESFEPECPECGHDAARAFPTPIKALEFQAQLDEWRVAE